LPYNLYHPNELLTTSFGITLRGDEFWNLKYC